VLALSRAACHVMMNKDVHCVQRKQQSLLFSCITLRKSNQFE